MSQQPVAIPLALSAPSLKKSFQKMQKLFLYVALLLITLCTQACETPKTIVNGLDEREANEIVVFLASKNIQAQKVASKAGQGAGGAAKEQLWDIAVSQKEAEKAMAILNSAGLPRRRSQSLLNIFSAGGLVPSEMQEKIRYQAGLADQIASTIRKIDGILDADVQLSFPEEDPLNPNAPKGKVTASAYVKHNGVLDDPNAHLVTKIKRLVASSVPNLNFDDVTVIGDKARFSDNSGIGKYSEPEKIDYVRVWSLVIAKDSLSTFRIIFGTLFVAVTLLSILLCLCMWKFYPLLKKRGGFKALVSLHPLADAMTEEEKKEGDEAPKEGEKGKEAPAKSTTDAPKVQENVES